MVSVKMARTAGRLPRRTLVGWAFVGPALLLFLVFKIIPIVVALLISFTRYDILTRPSFTGLENFGWLIHSEHFVHSLRITVYYAGFSTLILLPLSLLVALALDSGVRFQGFFRSVFLMPFMLSLFAAAIIWTQLYHPYGLVNSMLSWISPDRITWLTSERYALPAIVIMRIWWGTGYYTILFLAGLQSIPGEYYEAAKIDGAGAFKRFLRITLPLLSPILLFIIVISIISAFQTVDIFLIMTKGGPVDATRVLALLTYETGLKYFRMGRGSAMSLVLFVILMTFTIIQLRIFREEVKY